MEHFCGYRGLPVTYLKPLAYRCMHPENQKDLCRLNGIVEDNISICRTCALRSPPPIYREVIPNDHWDFKTTSDLVSDALLLCKYVPSNCRGICGVARSGMMPAAAIAAHMHLPLYYVSKEGQFGSVGHGIRFNSEVDTDGGFTEREKVELDGPLFVVDDSVHDGMTYWMVRKHLPSDHLFNSVYLKPGREMFVDHYAKMCPSPHLFEWNLLNTLMMAPLEETELVDPYLGHGAALDFDGIICQDPQWGDDRVDNLDWLLALKPNKYIPRRCRVQLIVTNRLEKWRDATDEWCKKWGVSYKKMIMSPYESAEERDKHYPQCAVELKGKAFLESECNLFIESDPLQAQLIHEYSKKPVLCPGSAQLFQK